MYDENFYFVAAEGAPSLRLAVWVDVIGALPKSLVKTVTKLPSFSHIMMWYRLSLGIRLKTLASSIQMLLEGRQYVGIKKIVRDGVTFFIDNEQYFKRGTVYGEWDDGEFWLLPKWLPELMEKVDLFQIFSMFMTTTQP